MYKSIALAKTLKTPHTVVGVFSDENSLPKSLNKLGKVDRNALTSAISTPGFKADLGEAIPVGDHPCS
ncbi:MAG: hypothetical protein O7G85_15565 [Planctomycetota bacterium]|nr:hypothetical protein [Planctomycetota bacterium]